MNPKLAGFTPEELIKHYKENLFDDFLPFMDQFIVDHKFGGFKCNTDRSGNNITLNKRTWFDGRGIWIYSYLYNNVKKDPLYLDIATKTVELVLKAKSPDEDYWPWAYNQAGEALTGHGPDIYGNLFVAEGLTEYSIAIGDPAYLEKAKAIIFDCVALYDREDYIYDFEYKPGTPPIQKPRVLGHWMILLNLCKGILVHDQDKKIEALANRCIVALLEKHLNPEFGLMIEFLEKDLSIPVDNNLDQFVYIGHAIEALWMIMDEAIRRNDDVDFSRKRRYFLNVM